jgi:hypothetical protein
MPLVPITGVVRIVNQRNSTYKVMDWMTDAGRA